MEYYYKRKRFATIFNKPIRKPEDLDDANAKCSESIVVPNPLFPGLEYKEVTLILTKKGKLTWKMPGLLSLSCYDRSLAKMKYISFSGLGINDVYYKTDCPLNKLNKSRIQ